MGVWSPKRRGWALKDMLGREASGIVGKETRGMVGVGKQIEIQLEWVAEYQWGWQIRW